MTESLYALRNVASSLPEKLAQYLEAQYHIWDETLVAERRRLLDAPGVIHGEPYLEATPSYVLSDSYDKLKLPPAVAALLSRAAADGTTGVPSVPYVHQAQALERFFADQLELVISTGTGSGKTESFLMPILGSLAIERAARPKSYARPATRALLLYPMNALVNDQMSRLRRLLGAGAVAHALLRADGFKPTFGMYTSRTPYPGVEDPQRTQEVVGKWIDRFFLRYSSQQVRLTTEGKWPAKDLAQFRRTFNSASTDSELLTRHEMHARPPDVLVTNYSMLEYMLLRPVDAPIFASTRNWLAEDDTNQFIIVLDEAHLYQGAQGTEVSLLLRRLISRLRIDRDRVRFILTSASLASGRDAGQLVCEFARQLTGARTAERFAYIVGQMSKPTDGRSANAAEGNAFASLDVDSLLNVDQDLEKSRNAAAAVADLIGVRVNERASTAVTLRDAFYSALASHPVAKALAGSVMGSPKRLGAVARELFPLAHDGAMALDGLLAATAFARRASDGRSLLPMRAHFLFRGLTGVYACVDPSCLHASRSDRPRLLGKLYAQPRIKCDCGARVYELLTHRDCGAAFLRGYYRLTDPDFLWHEPSTGLSGQGQTLVEVHLVVEHARDQVGGGDCVWLSKTTGRLLTGQMATQQGNNPGAFLELRRPTSAPVFINGRSVVTFDRRCPVCRGRWTDRNRPKIMDLATKGEDPFAHLIATQVKLQPPTLPVSHQSPNGGRKSLLFSDGRQKAARLARDLPRVIEQDAFRQVILLAADRLLAAGREARITDTSLYVGFIAVVSEQRLRFFDGADATAIEEHLRRFEAVSIYNGDLASALNDPWEPVSPQAYRMNVMRVLGSRFYSIYSLGLGYVRPRKSTIEAIRRQADGLQLSPAEIDALTVVWIQGALQHFALYGRASVTRRSRELAAGYPVTQAGVKSGFSGQQKRLFGPRFNVAAFEMVLNTHLTEQGDAVDLRLLVPEQLKVEPAIRQTWFRCEACTSLAPVTFQDACAACGSPSVITVPEGGDTYLRARKAFWRDPTERALMGVEAPMTLDVQEHTAQLGFRDLDAVEATTESYERRFRDILIDDERSIDVLSCTTTMEVGIDIGSLTAVGLRNMPPSRHNYQQRAGRAGRRGSAVSTVVTYAQNNAHDSHLFEHPEELIAGQPKLTGLDINNPALVLRHAFAEILQEFFEDMVQRRAGGNVFATLGDTAAFFSPGGDGSRSSLADWLLSDPAGRATLERIERWIPPGSRLSANDCRNSLLEKLRSLQSIGQGVLPSDEEQLIEFLFARGILPAYAFPRDLVALQIEELDGQSQVKVLERPQQGSNIALSEYAPGRLVVVNKQTYRIAAVTADLPATEVNRARPLFTQPGQYLQCSNCLYTADPASAATGRAGNRCPICALAPLQLVTVIQPAVVWPENRRPIDELDDDQVFSDTTVAQLPVPASKDAFESDIPFGPAARLLYGRQVPLIIMNRGELGTSGPGGFQVCVDCGHTVMGGQPFATPHDRHYHISRRRQAIPPRCNGSARAVFLGYEFRTDVLLLQTPLAAPFIHDLNDAATWPALRAALNSLANALALTAASYLDVDPRELQCGYRLQRTASGDASADVYIYDTLAGGAGYSRLIGEDFDEVYDSLCQRLTDCDCDSSCSRCLRTYSNRISHDSLDRFLALNMARYFKARTVPELLEVTAQQDLLAPVGDMMMLNGWTVTAARSGGIEAHRDGRLTRVNVVPALLDSTAYPAAFAGSTVLSAFEIQKDLPSCMARLPV